MASITSNSPILFHTDASRIARSTLQKVEIKQDLASGIYQFLIDVFPEQDLWFPAFNYDFIKTRKFDPKNDPIQVGALNESLRKLDEFTRSEIPVFSILRPISEEKYPFSPQVNPFDNEGEFSEIRRRDGNICFFGATIESLTFIHFIENLVSIPYRYLKEFTGWIKSENEMKATSLSYLVRPKGLALDYDWEKIHKLLKQSQIPFTLDGFGQYEIYNANQLTDFMIDRYSEDIFWTLTKDSKSNVEKKLSKLGRPFELQDFEFVGTNA